MKHSARYAIGYIYTILLKVADKSISVEDAVKLIHDFMIY